MLVLLFILELLRLSLCNFEDLKHLEEKRTCQYSEDIEGRSLIISALKGF